MNTAEPIDWCPKTDCDHNNGSCLNFYCNDTIASRFISTKRGYGREEVYQSVRCLPLGCLTGEGYYKDIIEGGQCHECYEKYPFRKFDSKKLQREGFKLCLKDKAETVA